MSEIDGPLVPDELYMLWSRTFHRWIDDRSGYVSGPTSMVCLSRDRAEEAARWVESTSQYNFDVEIVKVK